MSLIRPLRGAEPTQDSNLDNAQIIHDAMIVQTALPVTQLALIVPQVASVAGTRERRRLGRTQCQATTKHKVYAAFASKEWKLMSQKLEEGGETQWEVGTVASRMGIGPLSSLTSISPLPLHISPEKDRSHSLLRVTPLVSTPAPLLLLLFTARSRC